MYILHTVATQLENAFVCELFGSQTEALGRVLFLVVNSVSGEERDFGHLSHMNTSMVMFPRLVE